VSQDFLLLVQLPPSPGEFHDRFKIFQKFAEIFASQGAPLVSTTPVANLPLVSTTSAANFSTIFATGVKTTPVANCHQYQRHRRQPSVNDTGGKQWEQLSNC
jgi:hypothetical protein